MNFDICLWLHRVTISANSFILQKNAIFVLLFYLMIYFNYGINSTEEKCKNKLSRRQETIHGCQKKSCPNGCAAEQKTTVETPTISFYRISRMAADTLGVVLIFSGALFLFSLKYTDMNSITEWCFRYARLYAGKSAILPGFLSVFCGIWLIILRRIKKPFSFSWKVFAFFTLVYGYVLVVIQHIANTTHRLLSGSTGEFWQTQLIKSLLPPSELPVQQSSMVLLPYSS